MKKYIIALALILIFAGFPGTFYLHSEGNDETADSSTGAMADTDSDIMHPKFSLLDKDGNVIKDPSGLISTERTCGQCHDTRYINNHNLHYNDKVKADCIICHFKESKMDGDYAEANQRIQLPTDLNCSYCHGIVHMGTEPASIPPDYTDVIDYTKGKKFYNITQRTGVILSYQDMSHSALNLKDKGTLTFAWDVHSDRELNCISCHFIQNDPRYCGRTKSKLDHLTRDPRKITPPHQFLKRPHHDLNNAECTCCHNPFVIHKDMPYKKRHLEVLSCQSCHIPDIYGPAFRSVDMTVVTLKNTPRVEFRGVDESLSHGDSLNTKYYEGYRPFLFPHKNEDNGYNISPFNFVTRWFWKSGKTGATVPPEMLQAVYLDGNGYTADILEKFDSNKDKKIDNHELVLDTEEKINFIRQKLENAGFEEPLIQGTVNAYKINHGVVDADQMKRDCSACHAEKSGFGRDVVLAVNSPAGILPLMAADKNFQPLIDGTITRNENGEIVINRTTAVTGHYIFGHSRIKTLDRVGLWIFLISLLLVILHGGARYITSLKNPHPHVASKKVYMYRFYERLWHWTMAAGVLVLAFTGLEIHYSSTFTFFGLESAVRVHNVLAAILVINAGLSLFYHLTTGEIKQFFGFNRKFIQETLVQAFYYIYEIFKRKPHPINKSLERKLNPLQQLTYIGLLNILLPFQAITGILIWGADKWSFFSRDLNSLTFLAPIHNLGAWLFLTFLVVHIYLTTTGHTVLSNITAMITGYDQVEEGEPDEEHLTLMNMRVLDLAGTLIGKLAGRKKMEVPNGK